MKFISAAVLILSAALAPCLEGAGKRPNVVIVINDDESWFEASAYGRSDVQTPAFDQLARSGVLIRHGYTSAPSCAPSRAALLTGRNFWELEQGAYIQAWVPSKFARLPDLLAAAGYFTGYTGKGWGPGVVDPHGGPENIAGRAFNGRMHKEVAPGLSRIDYVANFAAFFRQKPRNAPFYFWVGVLEPHEPWGPDNYKKLNLPLEKITLPAYHPDTIGVRRNRANYLWEVEDADRTLAKVVALLRETGELENTIIIATADNGTPVPRMKADVYDEGLHVPMAISWPKGIPGGRRIDDFVNFIDLAPTILEAAGAPVPAEMSGRSVLSILKSDKSGQVDPERTWTMGGLEWHGTTHAGLPARMIRTQRFIYIRNYTDAVRVEIPVERRRNLEDWGKLSETFNVAQLIVGFPHHPVVAAKLPYLQEARPMEELYDCQVDPQQMNNLAADPRYAMVKARLVKVMEDYQRRTGDPRITGDLKIFNETLKFVQKRKASGYR